MASCQREFRPTANWDRLRRRGELLRVVRSFFDERGFLEVETPLLSHDTVVDRHLDPLEVCLFDDAREPRQGIRMWLQTSPEFCMKRLMASGAEAIYQITRAFRGGEQGPWHNPEFTMVEWYRAGDTLQSGMRLLDELAQVALGRGSAHLVSYGELFRSQIGLDPHHATAAELEARALQLGFPSPAPWDPADRDAWLDWLLVSHVAPTLGADRPAIVYDYPASQAALAQVRSNPTPVAERFELYVDGIELANGYHELLDPEVFLQRTHAANAARSADRKYSLPVESSFLAAMRHGLPPCTGVALGFDRLVMVAVGAQDLSQVMAFPVSHA